MCSCSAASTEVLQPLSATGPGGDGKTVAPCAEPSVVSRAATEQEAELRVGEAEASHQVEQLKVVPTSPGEGLHDVGDLGAKEVWSTTTVSLGSAGVGGEAQSGLGMTAEAAPGSPGVVPLGRVELGDGARTRRAS